MLYTHRAPVTTSAFRERPRAAFQLGGAPSLQPQTGYHSVRPLDAGLVLAPEGSGGSISTYSSCLCHLQSHDPRELFIRAITVMDTNVLGEVTIVEDDEWADSGG